MVDAYHTIIYYLMISYKITLYIEKGRNQLKVQYFFNFAYDFFPQRAIRDDIEEEDDQVRKKGSEALCCMSWCYFPLFV